MTTDYRPEAWLVGDVPGIVAEIKSEVSYDHLPSGSAARIEGYHRIQALVKPLSDETAEETLAKIRAVCEAVAIIASETETPK